MNINLNMENKYGFANATRSVACMLESLAEFEYVRDPLPADFEAAKQVARLVALAYAETIAGKFEVATAHLTAAGAIIDERQRAQAARKAKVDEENS